MEGDGQFRVGEAIALIHRGINRGIHMSGLYSHIFTESGVPGGRIQQGFSDYIWSLTSVLHAHRVVEDQLAFPLFRELSLDAPYERLEDEHLRIVPIVDEVRLKIERVVDDPKSHMSLERIDCLLAALADIWLPHIAIEEVHFSAANIDAVMSADEQTRLLAQIGEANLKHAGPDYLVIPFTLFNLPREDRASISDLMPPAVTRHLIATEWKEKWQAMSPFLLV